MAYQNRSLDCQRQDLGPRPVDGQMKSRHTMRMLASHFDGHQKAPSMEEAQNNQIDKMPQPDETYA